MKTNKPGSDGEAGFASPETPDADDTRQSYGVAECLWRAGRREPATGYGLQATGSNVREADEFVLQPVACSRRKPPGSLPRIRLPNKKTHYGFVWAVAFPPALVADVR